MKTIKRQLQLEIEELRARNEAQIEAEIYRRDLEEEIRLLKEEQEREKAEWIKSQEEAEKRYALALEEKINVKSQPHLINISKGTWVFSIETVKLVQTNHLCLWMSVFYNGFVEKPL